MSFPQVFTAFATSLSRCSIKIKGNTEITEIDGKHVLTTMYNPAVN